MPASAPLGVSEAGKPKAIVWVLGAGVVESQETLHPSVTRGAQKATKHYWGETERQADPLGLSACPGVCALRGPH